MLHEQDRRSANRIASLAAAWLAAAAVAIAALGAGALRAQNWVPSGSEFQASPAAGAYAALAREDNGDFVVVWVTDTGPDHEIHGRRFDASGIPKGTEFRVNAYTSGGAREPRVAMDSDGDFVVTWTSGARDGSFGGVFASRFNRSGVRQGREFQVNQYTLDEQADASVAIDADGDFVVAWHSYFQDGWINGVFARRFAANGTPLASEFLVNDYTSGIQNNPQVLTESDGDFLILWVSADQDGDGNGIFGRRYDSSGAPSGLDFQINSYTVGMQHLSGADLGSGGDLVVTWWGALLGDITARKFDASGTPDGPDFKVNTSTEYTQYFPVVAVDDDGAFVVAWHGRSDGLGEGVFARQFDSTGTALGAEFQVNAITTWSERNPAIAMDASGDFVVTWERTFLPISARRFVRLRTLDVDGNGIVGALNDGLMLVRWLFGFRGAALTGGAVGAGCTRCTPAEIEALLDALATLDVDGDGQVLALTDGLLIVRAMFGFSGAALIAGAVGPDCTRCDAPSIAQFVEAMM